MDLFTEQAPQPGWFGHVITGNSPGTDLCVAVGRVYSGRMSSVA
jgi:hypothetical protein